MTTRAQSITAAARILATALLAVHPDAVRAVVRPDAVVTPLRVGMKVAA